MKLIFPILQLLTLAIINYDFTTATNLMDMKITYKVYNRKFPNGKEIFPEDSHQTLREVFIIGSCVKLITHGWQENEYMNSVESIRTAYALKYDCNVVTVGWGRYASGLYLTATMSVPAVGKDIGTLVCLLHQLGIVNPYYVHLIGHGLGAQVMGIAGNNVYKLCYAKVGRLTGLDTASLGYKLKPPEEKFDATDAMFVDAIHTCSGIKGFFLPIAHADFYPNGGWSPQPGCTLDTEPSCSHQRSYEYFADSIINPLAYPAMKCNSYLGFKLKQCRSNEIVLMGSPTPSRNFPNGVEIFHEDSPQKLRYVFIVGSCVKFITHGWLEDEYRDCVEGVRRAYALRYDCNLVTVGWGPYSMTEYVAATMNVPIVGRDVASFICLLIQLGIFYFYQIHLVGHSLGSHVMGIAGNEVSNLCNGKVGRLTGLDPAGPLYEFLKPPYSRFDSMNARFVDAIHTCSGAFGYAGPLAHADFYPNGGTLPQPGCPLIAEPLCSHQRSYQYFIDSIIYPYAYPAVSCDSYMSFLQGRCMNNEVVLMGDPTPSSAYGTYFLTTGVPITLMNPNIINIYYKT